MIALTGLKIFIADIAANYCCRAYKFNYWRYKTFINPFCLRSFRFFYFNLASVSDAFRPVHDQ